MMGRFSVIDPFIFDFGGLPRKGESNVFKQNIAKLVSTFRSSIKLFQKVYVPLEIDVQVTQTGLKLGKDLDNIMIDICSEIQKQLLQDGIHINGYRIYVVDSVGSDIKSGIQLRLLPAGEILAFNNRVERAVDILESTWGDDL
jgi:hypothetical protein